MRRAIGPIVTTGVAIVAAGVVVANPIMTSHGDLKIPNVSLSGDAGMLDPAFLEAIAPNSSDSGGPFSVLKQLISALTADSSYLGKNAVIDAFVAGFGMVTNAMPEGGPFVPPSAEALGPTVLPPSFSNLVAGFDPSLISAGVFDVPLSSVSSSLDSASAFLSNAVFPAVTDAVSAIASDVSYVGQAVISAAFAVGAAVAQEPELIGDTIRALLNGDFQAAFENAIKVITAPLGPPINVLVALQTVIQNRLSDLAELFGVTPPAVTNPSEVAPPASARSQLAAASTAAPSGDTAPAVSARMVAPAASALAVAPRSAASVAGPSALAPIELPKVTLPALQDLKLPPPPDFIGAMRDKAQAVGEQIGASARGLANAVGKQAAKAKGDAGAE